MSNFYNFSEYSEDEVSDLSLDELTDEEHEDLRATLNKNKTVKRVHNVTVSTIARYTVERH